jgi:4-hydroxy-2-oxoheptanedioate aldolase
MKKVAMLLSLALACWFAGRSVQSSSPTPDTKRINKAIDLLERGQPIYYTTSRGGYEEGKKLAQTWADYVNYELEHGAFDMTRLREFVQGLVDGGPTKSGHRTPAVIATLPILGLDAHSVRANHWVIQQVLAAGVHGVLLCHARSPEAVRAFVEAARYPFHKEAVGEGLREGLRGSGSQGFAAKIWGIPPQDYLRVADTWPLNPNGELLLGLKIEDRHALQNAGWSTKVPGIGFAEWGPGDMGFSYGIISRTPGEFPKVMLDARSRVLAATKAANIFFLDTVTHDNVEAMIDEGVMIGAANHEAAEKGRRYAQRQMPR